MTYDEDFAAGMRRAVEAAINGGDGFWRSCSGCYETIDGHPTSHVCPVFKCVRGCGCGECGGVGAVWDNTDYGAMGDYLARIQGDSHE